MKKNDILNSIRYYGNVHLKPSKVCDGVGVFALIDIPPFTSLFGPNSLPDTLLLTWSDLEGCHENTIEYLKRVCSVNEEGVFLSRRFNDINMSYYVNHSLEPNVHYDVNRDEYTTIRYIYAGEEILCKYLTHEIDWN